MENDKRHVVEEVMEEPTSPRQEVEEATSPGQVTEEPKPPGYEPATDPLPGYEPDAEPVPVYVEDGPPSLHRMVYARENSSASAPQDISDIEAWHQYTEIYPPSKTAWNERGANENSMAESSLYASINLGKEDVIAFLIENDIVTPNTKLTSTEETPLLRAVTQKNVRVVQQLLDLGAEKDAFGSVSRSYSRHGVAHTLRTPLQHAASLGHLVLVKLLMERYHCDDSIVAPDGQIALRLAAENGHYEVVDYLPPRRLGGFRRWKHSHRKALRRTVKSLRNIAGMLKFLSWDVPRFFLWTVPKHVIVKPISKGCAWCWENRKAFGPWCKRELLKVPGRIGKAGKGCWKFATKTLPSEIRNIAVWSWKLVTEGIPSGIRKIAVWLWKLVTRVPIAMGILARWISSRTVACGKAIWNVILKIASFFSTVAEAVISFLRRVTLADVWNGFVEILKAAFVTFPKAMLSWLETFGKTSYKVMKALLGGIGQGLWWIGFALGWVIIYIPRQLWKALKSFGESFVRGFYELRVWLDPKAR